MGPLHSGKSDVLLYSNKLQSVNMCLSSGKLATGACGADIRLVSPLSSDFIATSQAAVYPEDVPTQTCDKHVLVDYCSGGGVATDACHQAAQTDPSVTITKRGLVKMTQSEIDEILKASPYNLIKDYTRDDYVYYVNPDGSDGWFRGIRNNLSQSVKAPYKVCPKHN